MLGAIALVGMFGFSVFMLIGMRHVSGVLGSSIMSTTPSITALGAFLFLNNQLGWRKIGAVVLAVVGVLVLQLNREGASGGGEQVLLGSVLVFLAVCSEAAFTLLGRVASEALNPVLITFLASLGALGLFLPFMLYDASRFDPSAVTLGQLLGLLWWGVGTLALGTVVWYSGVQRVEGSTAAGFMGVMPLSALVLSYLLLGEPFRVVHLLGFGIVLSGILLLANAHRQR
ncbi:MAG: DMT family transporter [Anaerolineae bacterium]|nr:DMT family transporter [Anaerolineae bacterium]